MYFSSKINSYLSSKNNKIILINQKLAVNNYFRHQTGLLIHTNKK